MERPHARRVRPGNDVDLLAALGADLPERDVAPPAVLARIDAHVRAMRTILVG